MSGTLINFGAQALPQVTSALEGVPGIGDTASSVLAIIRQPRKIDTIVPDVTIEETFSDQLEITKHPVAVGTPMSDHAFLHPRTVTMKIGFTNSNPVGSTLQGFFSGGGFSDLGKGLEGAASGLFSSFTETRAKQVYQTLIDLQFNTNPSKSTANGGTTNAQYAKDNPTVKLFTLICGKRTYDNMVIERLEVRNDAKSEYALIIDVHMQQVITVSAGQSQQPTTDQQSMPQKTSGTTNGGSSTPVPNSLLTVPFGVQHPGTGVPR